MSALGEHENRRPIDEDRPGKYGPRGDGSDDKTGTVESPALHLDEAASFEQIIPRVLRNILVFGIVFLGPIFWIYRLAGLLGFIAGSLISYVNFRVLSRGVEALTDRIVNQESREKGGAIVFRFVVRYGLVALIAYAIFKSSAFALRGFLWGLCVPVAALMLEAVGQGFAAFRRSS
jgi:hypothetical protein